MNYSNQNKKYKRTANIIWLILLIPAALWIIRTFVNHDVSGLTTVIGIILLPFILIPILLVNSVIDLIRRRKIGVNNIEKTRSKTEKIASKIFIAVLVLFAIWVLYSYMTS